MSQPNRNRIVQGDALETLRGWPAGIAQLCIRTHCRCGVGYLPS